MKFIKKIITLLVSATILTAAFPVSSFAKTSMPDYIRVGIRSNSENKSSIGIQSTDIKLVKSNDSKNNPLDYNEVAEFTSSTGFAVRTGISYQVAIPVSANNLSEAKSQVQNYISQGYPNAVVGYNNNSWAVTIYGYSTLSEAKSDASKLNGVALSPQEVTILSQDGNPILLITKSDAFFVGTGDIPTIDLGSYEYRGIMEFMQTSDGLLTAVNFVDFEQYLYGVVPSEIPSSYNYEAIKAQACAARTYAISKLALKSTIGYDVCDTTHCQVYLGRTNESATATKAVDETKGVAIYYQGSPIEALFSSSTGGYTEDAKNVWGTDVPYLKAVPDEYEISCQEWERTITLSDINAIASANGYQIGSATGMRITIDNKTSRVQKIEFIGTSGSKTVTQEDCRTIFGTSGTSLNSRNFTITNGVTESTGSDSSSSETVYGTYISGPISGYTMSDESNYIVGSDCAIVKVTSSGKKAYDSNGKEIDISKVPDLEKLTASAVVTSTSKTGTTVIRSSGSTIQLSGRGIGHGVGMSQRGANGYAAKGYSYIEILKHYYTGVTIE